MGDVIYIGQWAADKAAEAQRRGSELLDGIPQGAPPTVLRQARRRLAELRREAERFEEIAKRRDLGASPDNSRT